MGAELQVATTADVNVYVVVRDAAGLVWQTTTSTFVTFADANVGNYDVALVEQGTSSGYYVGDFPLGITGAGTYLIAAYRRVGGSPAVGDALVATGKVVWDGSAEVVPSTGDDLTTTSYVKRHLQIDVDTYDAVIGQFVTAGSAAVTKYLGRRLNAASYSEVRSGEGTDFVRAYNPPITSVTSVVYDVDTSSPTTVAGSEYVYEAATGILKPKRTSTIARYFAEGFQNITINYNAGFVEIPADVQTAVAMICGTLLYVWNNNYMGVVEKAVGDVKIKYADLFSPTGDANLSHPVFGPAVALLRPYKIVRY